MDNDLEDKILTKINSYKHKNKRKSLLAGMETTVAQTNTNNINNHNINDKHQDLIHKQQQKQEPVIETTIVSQANIEAQILAKFDQMLMFKMKSIQNVLTSIENKVENLEPKFQIQVDNSQIITKVQKTINESLDKSISGIKNSIGMSINYYNDQLRQRQKRFNKEHQETAKIAFQSHKNTLDLRGKNKQTDFKRLQERIKMLMRSENKCEDILSKIDKQLIKITDTVKDFNEKNALGPGYQSLQDDELVEISEQQILEMIFKNCDIQIDSPEMKDYIFQQIGIKPSKR